MENIQEAKQLISQAKNICIIPDDSPDGESISIALALFYTLKELNKNVNIVIDDLPEKFKFLLPSIDFISHPKNFVISIPQKTADISQVYYEKNEDGLKIHLTLDKGNIKKDNISFYFSEAKPDLIITLGIKDFKSQLSGKLNSFGFLLDSPILNIDSETIIYLNDQNVNDMATRNQNFGRINMIKDISLSEQVLDLVKNPHIESVKKEAANCFLTGLTIYTDNFSNSKTTSEIFETASLLMKIGADLKEIRSKIF
jgi:nanoRNase/pAp phosphatase (c-di-AMP/oligoRNAs hydrolase)